MPIISIDTGVIILKLVIAIKCIKMVKATNYSVNNNNTLTIHQISHKIACAFIKILPIFSKITQNGCILTYFS